MAEAPTGPAGPLMLAPFRQTVLNVHQFGEHWSWRCGVGDVALADREQAGCRYDHTVASWEQVVTDALVHHARWHNVVPHPEEDCGTALELYGISGHTDAIADGLVGEARWLVDLAGRCLRDAADIIRKETEETP